MNRYPFKKLPFLIRDILYKKVVSRREDKFPSFCDVGAATKCSLILPAKDYSTPFSLVVCLKNKTYEFAYYYPYGSVKYKKIREVVKNTIIVKGYVNNKNEITNLTVTFHKSQLPKTIKNVILNNRKRQILFIFSKFKDGHYRRKMIEEFSILDSEIENLIAENLLIKTLKSKIKLSWIAENSRDDLNKKDLW